ncbi:MAG: hypothetical protein IJW91_04105 [Phascolarctobacterium sp.]|nr:hypothetical protein [Phascolarctobacterium sp.]
MKFKGFFLGLLLCCYTCAAFANVPLMPIQDLKPGMQGIGKTVIKGDTIEEFNVEILGVSGSEAAGYSILVRLYGDLIEKTGGVAQGMSGSPVYVDGRLVGAVAFGKMFNDPHYCFLTPIHSMLKLIDMPATRSGDWIPKGTGLLAGGFTPMGMEYLQERLQGLGLEAVAGGGSGSEKIGSLEAGSAVAASLMQGDLTLGALGTVTWVDDKGNVLAFGHPFMQRGESNFFMNKVWILGCIPNMQSSYKVGNIGEAIGTFTQDRASGIGGREGKAPASIPVFVSVSDTARGQNTAVRVRIVEDEKLVPAILDAAVFNTVTKTMDRNGGGTARLQFEISGVDKEKNLVTIDRENMFYATEGLSKLMNLEMVEAANILMQNKFEKIDIYGITVTAEITDDVQVAEIMQVSTPKRDVKPGDKIPFEVTLKPYRGEEFTKTAYFTVPKNHPGGKLALSVRGGSSLAWIQKLLRKQQDEGMPAQEKEKKASLADFIKKFNEADKNNELIIDMASGMPSAMNMEEIPEAGLAGMLQGSPYKQKQAFDFIIDGDKEIILNVDK